MIRHDAIDGCRDQMVLSSTDISDRCDREPLIFISKIRCRQIGEVRIVINVQNPDSISHIVFGSRDYWR